jgi:hypothetical protein
VPPLHPCRQPAIGRDDTPATPVRCTLGDQLAPLLLEARTALSQIGAIDLSRNGFGSQVSGRLAAALPNASIGEQGRGAPDFFMRYVATME